MRRIRHACLILIGKIQITPQTEFIMALEKTQAAVANLKAAASAMIAHCQDHVAAAAAVEAADAANAADIQAVADQLNGAAADPVQPSA